MTFHIYLTFDGQCEAAFNFYKSVFGGKFDELKYFKDIPQNYDVNTTHVTDDKIMHISLPITKHFVLLGCDAEGPMKQQYQKGTNFSISLNVKNKKKARKIFERLSNHGEVHSPLAETFWGSYFGMITDQFGIQWMVSAPL